jgi:hypothetical protein
MPEDMRARNPRNAFDCPQMHALRDRLRRRQPNVGMLKVWNGNEGPTLEQLVEALPPKGGLTPSDDDLCKR